MRVGHSITLARAARVSAAPITPPDLAPQITGQPEIAGEIGIGNTLRATPATAFGRPAPARSWQWQRDGIDIPGATLREYTITADDTGRRLSVVQTEANSAGTATATSAATGVVQGTGDTTAPVLSNTSFNAGTATFDTTEGGTLHWALWTLADGQPVLGSGGTWTGTVAESGSEPVSGANGTLTPSYSATSFDRLSYGIIDAAGNVSALVTVAYAPAPPASSYTPVYLSTAAQQGNDLSSGGTDTVAGAFPDADTFIVVMAFIGAGAGMDLAISGPNVTAATRIAQGFDANTGTAAFVVTTSGASDLVLANAGDEAIWSRRFYIYRASGAGTAGLVAGNGGESSGPYAAVTLASIPSGSAAFAVAVNWTDSAAVTGVSFSGDFAGPLDASADLERSTNFITGVSSREDVASSLTTQASFTPAETGRWSVHLISIEGA